MKKFVLILIVALVAGGALFAQTTPNFTDPTPQFFSFDLGAGFGIAMDTNAGFGSGNEQERIGGVGNFGFKIEVLDNFSVGFDSLFSVTGTNNATNVFSGLRLSYNFIPQAGASIGFGTTTQGNSTTEGAVALGFYGSFLQNRSATGITTGIRLRIDFVAPFADLGTGKVVFTPAFNIGL